MELWHLDYQKSVSVDADRHLKIVIPVDGETAAPLVAQAFDEGLYRKVALVDDTISASELFHLTQNDNNWSSAPPEGIVPVSETPPRSTSVGDVLITRDGHFVLALSGPQQFFPAAVSQD